MASKPSPSQSPFLPQYDRQMVALVCGGCGVIYWPKFMAEDGACPFCHTSNANGILMSTYQPAQDPRGLMNRQKREERLAATPPQAFRDTLTDKQLGKVRNLRVDNYSSERDEPHDAWEVLE